MIGLLSEWLKRRVRLPYEWNESGRLTDDEFKRLKEILNNYIEHETIPSVKTAWIEYFLELKKHKKTTKIQ